MAFAATLFKPRSDEARSIKWAFPFFTTLYTAAVLYFLCQGFWIRQSVYDSVLESSDFSKPGVVAVIKALRELRVNPVLTAGNSTLSLKSRRYSWKGFTQVANSVSGIQYRYKQAGNALWMCLLLLCFVLIAWSRVGRSLVVVSQLAPALIAVFAVPLVSNCVNCTVGGDNSAWLTKWCLVALPITFAVLMWMFPERKARFAACLVSGAVVATQVLLLFHTPKFCIFCLLIGCCVISFASSAAKSELIALHATHKSSIVVTLSLALMFSAFLVAAAANLIQPLASNQMVPGVSFIDKNITSFVNTSERFQSCILLAKLRRCHSCEAAQHDLHASQLSYKELDFCGTLHGQGC